MTTQYERYGDGRIFNLTYPGGRFLVRYQYDTAGNVAHVEADADNQRTTTYEVDPEADYDAWGHLLKESYGNGVENRYGFYPQSGRLMQSQTVKQGEQELIYRNLIYAYDVAKNIRAIVDWGNGPSLNTGMADIRYDGMDRLVSYQRANDWERQERYEYGYDTAGNITLNDHWSQGMTYGFGGDGKLIRVREGRFEYDDRGNITVSPSRGSYEYNVHNQLAKVTMANGREAGFEYDFSGRRYLKELKEADGTLKKTYYVGSHYELRDGQPVHNVFAGGKLIAVVALPREAAVAGEGGEGAPGAGAGYVDWGKVDPWGVFPLPLLCAVVLLWWMGVRGKLLPLHGGRRCLALFGVGAPKVPGTFCSYSMQLRLASWFAVFVLLIPSLSSAAVFPIDVPDNWPPPSDAYFLYVHSDHLGSSNLFTEGEERTTHAGLRYRQGDLVQRIEYTPFGQERFVLNPALEEGPKYTGQTQDIETDLYYYASRYYDPVLSRFIQPDSIIPDPYNSQSLNPYSYVLNNPLAYVDPSGHIFMPIGIGYFPSDGSYDFSIPDFVPLIGGFKVSVSGSASVGIFNLSTTGEHSILAPASIGFGIDFSLVMESASDLNIGSLQYGLGENLGFGVSFVESNGELEVTGVVGGLGFSLGSPVQGSVTYDVLETLASISEEGTVTYSKDKSFVIEDFGFEKSLDELFNVDLEKTLIENF